MLTQQLAKILKKLPSPGKFYSTNSLEIFPPRLEVNQIGRISLPLLPVQAEQLINISEQAPYGKGYDTLVDTEVRRTWQIDASNVNLTGKYWQKNLSEIVDKVKLDLGVDCEVSADLYKLLVYEKGDFFVSHRDTEKVDSMFATLVIVLPSDYSGGELVVRHQQDEVKLDLHSVETEEISFAAFYADCVHEVLPITEGCRLTLIYNLIRNNKKIPLPSPPDYYQAEQETTQLLNNWQQALNKKTIKQNLPEKLIYLLEHEYSIAELNFNALKNKDKASADVLIAAANQADCKLYLALISIEESGYAEHTGGGYYNHWNNNEEDDEYEIGEVLEHYEAISEWRSPDGSQPQLPHLPFKAIEFCPPEAFNSMEPKDTEFQEATGNAGASFDRMYHCAALVLWPRTHYLSILNQAGLEASLPVLSNLCQQWKKDQNPQAQQDALTLATFLMADWVADYFDESKRNYRSDSIPSFLICLQHIEAIELIKQLWEIIAKTGLYQQNYATAFAKSSKFLTWPDVVDYTTACITVSAPKAQSTCVALLSGLCRQQKSNTENRYQLSAAALLLSASLAGDDKRFPGLPSWQINKFTLSPDEVADLIISFNLINTEIVEKVLDYMLAWPLTYDIDKILLSAALQIKPSDRNNKLLAVVRLRQFVIEHLQLRLDKPLEPPADWHRPPASTCSCSDCAELNQFLNNATLSQWRFKAAEARRNHLQYFINSNKSDIDYLIDKAKRPYSLVY